MTVSSRTTTLLALAGFAVSSLALAQNAPSATPAAPGQTVTVEGTQQKPRRVAPAWEQGRAYKYRELASYDGWAFQAGSGAAHKRPNVNAEDGWEKLNPCDDPNPEAVRCELGNQAVTTDAQADAQREYDRVKQDMQKGKPVNRPEG